MISWIMKGFAAVALAVAAIMLGIAVGEWTAQLYHERGLLVSGAALGVIGILLGVAAILLDDFAGID